MLKWYWLHFEHNIHFETLIFHAWLGFKYWVFYILQEGTTFNVRHWSLMSDLDLDTEYVILYRHELSKFCQAYKMYLLFFIKIFMKSERSLIEFFFHEYSTTWQSGLAFGFSKHESQSTQECCNTPRVSLFTVTTEKEVTLTFRYWGKKYSKSTRKRYLGPSYSLSKKKNTSCWSTF